MTSDLLTRDEAVARLRVSERSFARHVAPGLASVRIGSRILYRLDEVERWLRDHEAGPSNATHERASNSSGSGMPGVASTGQRVRRIAERLSGKRHGSTTR